MDWVGFGNTAYVPAIFWPRKGPVLFLLIKIGTPPRIKFYKFLIYGSYIFEVHYPTWIQMPQPFQTQSAPQHSFKMKYFFKITFWFVSNTGDQAREIEKKTYRAMNHQHWNSKYITLDFVFFIFEKAHLKYSSQNDRFVQFLESPFISFFKIITTWRFYIETCNENCRINITSENLTFTPNNLNVLLYTLIRIWWNLKWKIHMNSA